MKLALIAAIAAASLAGAVAPASAEARQEVRPDTILQAQYHRPFHHRHRVCVIRHHRQFCSYR